MQKAVLLILLALLHPLSYSSAEKRQLTKGRRVEYYVFGMVSVMPRTVDSIEKAYGVRIINNACMLDKAKLAKNKAVDSLLRVRYNKSMAEILRATSSHGRP
jgi:hypothetical protein